MPRRFASTPIWTGLSAALVITAVLLRYPQCCSIGGISVAGV
jgi:hypothetical protein